MTDPGINDHEPRRVVATLELLHALAQLDVIEREVWVDRHMVGRTLQQIADEFAKRDPKEAPDQRDGHPRKGWPGTRERIRQIEKDATNHLAKLLRNNEALHAKLDDPDLSARIRRRV